MDLVPGPMNIIRCFKCQGLEHIALDYPSRKVITVAEWESMKEDEVEEEGVENQEEEKKKKKIRRK